MVCAGQTFRAQLRSQTEFSSQLLTVVSLTFWDFSTQLTNAQVLENLIRSAQVLVIKGTDNKT